MVQNERFIQYLGLLLFVRLKEKEEFLECPVWRLYLKLKQICQLVCSDTISERQKTELEDLIHSFIDIRIALHMKWKSHQKTKFCEGSSKTHAKIVAWQLVRRKQCECERVLLMRE